MHRDDVFVCTPWLHRKRTSVGVFRMLGYNGSAG